MNENTLYNQDCMEIMKQMEDDYVDLTLTDPPYGIGMSRGHSWGGFGFGGKQIIRKDWGEDWDNERPAPEYFIEMQRVSKLCVIFGGNYFADILPLGTHWLVWNKHNTMPSYSDAELLWTNSHRKSVKLFDHEWNGCFIGRAKTHPTEKPVELLEKILESYSEEGQLIFDPFAGSGATLVAAKKHRRRYIGCEIMEKHYHNARRRLESTSVNLFKQEEE